MHRAEQRGPPAGQRRQVLVTDRPGAHLLRRLGQPVADRAAGQRARQGGQRPGGLLAEPGEPVGERVVEPRHQVERLADPGRGVAQELSELYVEHHRTALVAGNQCSSASGSVLSGTSR